MALYRLNALVHKGMYRTSLGSTPEIGCLRLEHYVSGWDLNLFGDGIITHVRSRNGEIDPEDERGLLSSSTRCPVRHGGSARSGRVPASRSRVGIEGRKQEGSHWQHITPPTDTTRKGMRERAEVYLTYLWTYQITQNRQLKNPARERRKRL